MTQADVIWWTGVCYVPGDDGRTVMTMHQSPPTEDPLAAWREAEALGREHSSTYIGVMPRYREQLTGEEVAQRPFGH